MAEKSVFVSFDYDNDRQYKFLLEAWHANPKFRFVFNDTTPGEINTYNIDRIKAGLTTRIREADYTLVIVGSEANSIHRNYQLIGFRNWINFEVYQSLLAGNRIAVVKLEPHFQIPEQLANKAYAWIDGFTEPKVMAVLDKAATLNVSHAYR